MNRTNGVLKICNIDCIGPSPLPIFHIHYINSNMYKMVFRLQGGGILLGEF